MRYILAFLTVAGMLVSTVQGQIQDVDSVMPTYVIRNIVLVGNIKTKSWVIERELSFKRGDSLSLPEFNKLLERSKNNLWNTSLFTSTDVRFTANDAHEADVFVVVSERWYVWPQLIFELAETNFNSWWENKDFSRINYGVRINHKNFRGRNEEFNVVLQFGFTELMALSYKVPYFNKSRTLGIAVAAAYGQNHEVNYISSQNRRLFFKDVNNIQQRFLRTGAELTFRPKIRSKHGFGFSYSQVDISDTVKALNPDYLPNDRTKETYLSAHYSYIMDHRDNKAYPLRGHYLKAAFSQFGLGLLESDMNESWTELEMKKYFRLSDRWYFGAMARGQAYFTRLQPYYLRQGLGYTDKTTVRSYELYVIDAQQFAVGKAQIRYRFISTKPKDLEFIPLNKFRKFYLNAYLGLFTDFGYAWDAYKYPLNSLANDIQNGNGISLDIHSVYDLVFRAEYSINKFGEHGLFLHFVAPI